MKKLFLLLHLSFIAAHSSLAQADTLRYSQENGTLQKQYFIDQYDYVFMTKEPTKWMGKFFFGMIPTPLRGLSLTMQMGVEHKLSPSLSLGLNMTTPAGNGSLIYSNITTEMRWYYDMKRRMNEGVAANNFSGNYFNLRYDRALVFSNEVRNFIMKSPQDIFPFYSNVNIIPSSQIGAGFGLQRRFLRTLFFDFGLQLTRTTFDKYTLDANQSLRRENYAGWGFSTEWRYGLSFGSWKRGRRKIPTCEVIRCAQDEKGILKLGWPLLHVSQNRQNVVFGIGYERKIADKSPISVHIDVTQNYSRNYIPDYIGYVFSDSLKKYVPSYTGGYQFVTSSRTVTLQGRYNLLQRRQLANNLSGIYVGLNTTYEWITKKHSFDDKNLNISSWAEIIDTIQVNWILYFEPILSNISSKASLKVSQLA